MIKRLTLSIIAIGLLSIAAPVSAKPTTIPGKIGASVLQIIHRHPYYTSLAATIAYIAKARLAPDDGGIAVLLAGWIIGGTLTRTVSKVLMDNFDIEPVKD